MSYFVTGTSKSEVKTKFAKYTWQFSDGIERQLLKQQK